MQVVVVVVTAIRPPATIATRGCRGGRSGIVEAYSRRQGGLLYPTLVTAGSTRLCFLQGSKNMHDGLDAISIIIVG